MDRSSEPLEADAVPARAAPKDEKPLDLQNRSTDSGGLDRAAPRSAKVETVPLIKLDELFLGITAGIVLALALYLLPAIVALCRRHHNFAAIAALNILLGWTFLGWVAALIWSLTAVDSRAHYRYYVPDNQFSHEIAARSTRARHAGEHRTRRCEILFSTFNCSCGNTIECDQELVGQWATCNACGAAFVIPGSALPQKAVSLRDKRAVSDLE